MSTPLFYFLLVCIFLFVLILLRSLMEKKITMKQAIRWLVVIFAMIIALAFPNVFKMLSVFLGFEITSNMIFFVAIFLLFFIVYYMNIEITQHKKHIILLTQELSILKARFLEEDIRDEEK